jgi:flagellar biosynthesis component FlhA
VADRPKLELMGVVVLGPLGHVARWLESDLRRYAATFVDQRMVKGLLEDLGTMFPVLVAAASVKWPVWRLTRVLRSIVAESVPCSDLRFALERLLDYDRVLVSGADTVILADKLLVTGGGSAGSMDDATIEAEFLRLGLGPYLVGRLRSMDPTLYRLDERLERLVMPGRTGGGVKASSSPPDEATRDAILSSVGEAVAGSRVPFAILTASSEARPYIRQIVAEEFPDAMVLSQQEIPAGAPVDAPVTIVPAS